MFYIEADDLELTISLHYIAKKKKSKIFSFYSYDEYEPMKIVFQEMLSSS